MNIKSVLFSLLVFSFVLRSAVFAQDDSGQFSVEKVQPGNRNRAVDLSVDDLVSLFLEGQRKLEHLFLSFDVVCCNVESQQQIDEGKGEIVGKAYGFFWRNKDNELLVVNQGDVFKLIPQDHVDGSRSFLVPFPGPQLTVKNANFIVQFFAVTGQGTIGEVDQHFPRQLFHPLKCLALVGSDRLADPLNWLLFPPAGTKLTSGVNPDNSAFVTDGKSMRIHFDLERSAAISMFSFGDEAAPAVYQVNAFRKLENDGWVPERATAITAKEGFPKRVFYWKLKDASVIDKDDRTVIKLIEEGWKINNVGLTQWIRLKEGTEIGADCLDEIFEALGQAKDMFEGRFEGCSEAPTSKVIIWPQSASGINSETRGAVGK